MLNNPCSYFLWTSKLQFSTSTNTSSDLCWIFNHQSWINLTEKQKATEFSHLRAETMSNNVKNYIIQAKLIIWQSCRVHLWSSIRLNADCKWFQPSNFIVLCFYLWSLKMYFYCPSVRLGVSQSLPLNFLNPEVSSCELS